MSTAWLDEPIPADLALAEEPLNEEDVALLVTLEPEERRTRFTITDDDQAEWAMRKLSRAEHELVAAQTRRAAWTARVESWFQDVTRQPTRDAAFFATLLEEYARSERGKGRKSVSLPSGKVSSRGSAEPKVTVTEEEVVLAWNDSGLEDAIVQLVAETLDHNGVSLPVAGAAAVRDLVVEKVEAALALTSRKLLVTKLRERVQVVTAEDGSLRVIQPDTGEDVPGVAAEVPEPTFTVTVNR